MSVRYEQYRSLVETRQLLHDIVSRRVGLDLVERAAMCARHYPFLDETGAPMFSQDWFETPPIRSAYEQD